MISRVNIGICHRRVQVGEPPFFVNWVEDGESKYKFFAVRFLCESFKDRLNAKNRKSRN
jgi:hypothetical protein